MFEPIERLHGGVVAKADGGEGDEAEVGGSGGGPDGDDEDDDGGDDDPDQPSQEAKRMAPMKMNPKMSIRLTMMGTITCITTIITITKIVTITRSVGMYRSFPISSKPIPRDLENSWQNHHQEMLKKVKVENQNLWEKSESDSRKSMLSVIEKKPAINVGWKFWVSSSGSAPSGQQKEIKD